MFSEIDDHMIAVFALGYSLDHRLKVGECLALLIVEVPVAKDTGVYRQVPREESNAVSAGPCNSDSP